MSENNAKISYVVTTFSVGQKSPKTTAPKDDDPRTQLIYIFLAL